MQCREIENLVMKYLDGNISELEMEKITRHNEVCPKCALEFEVLSDAIYTIEEFPDLEVPEDFTSKVMNNIRNQKHYELNNQTMLLWLIGMAGLAVFMLNVFYHVVLPTIKSSAIFASLVDKLALIANWTMSGIKDIFLTCTVVISKLVVFRNILLRDYLTLLIAGGIIFIMVNILLVKTLKVQQKP